MFYLEKIRKKCPLTSDLPNGDFAVPHQAISPREILKNWVRNDSATVVHDRVEDWNKGDVHPNSIREFEDKFEAMEYLSELKNSPVTIDNVGNPIVEDSSDVSSVPDSSVGN